MTLEAWHIVVGVLGVILGPGGVCYAVLNGTRTAVKETREDVKEIRATLGEHGNRLTRIETKMEDR